MPPFTSFPEMEDLAAKEPLLHEIFLRLVATISNVPVVSGKGSPQNKVPAAPGQQYIDTSAPIGASGLWVKDSGNGVTGWAPVTSFGSAPPNVSASFAWSATGGGGVAVTIFWDGTNASTILSLFRPDRSRTIVPGARQVISSLTLNSARTVFPYFDERSGQVKFVVAGEQVGDGTITVPAGDGNPQIAFAAGDFTKQKAAQRISNRVPMGSFTINSTNGQSGTGGGAGS